MSITCWIGDYSEFSEILNLIFQLSILKKRSSFIILKKRIWSYLLVYFQVPLRITSQVSFVQLKVSYNKVFDYDHLNLRFKVYEPQFLVI